jgi:hypothetical protein
VQSRGMRARPEPGRRGPEVYMPVVMPTVTGTRATVAQHAGNAPERTPASNATDAERSSGRRIRGASSIDAPVRMHRNPFVESIA